MSEQCVYCGTTESLTNEHAPPKFLFPRPWPSDFITVRACSKCNSAGQLDAEYFRVCLCLKLGEETSDTLSLAKDAVRRSLDRPESASFRNSLIQAMEPEGNKIAFAADIKRLHKVVERIVQCLYLHETGNRLNPETHEVAALGNDFLLQLGNDAASQIKRDFVIPLSECEPKIIGGDVFAYSSMHTAKEFVSVWGLLFYGAFPFIAFTGPRKRPLNTPI